MDNNNREYTTCYFCNNNKIKVNKIIKHKQTCQYRPSESNNTTTQCPYNAYHWVKLGDLEFHKQICQNKPKEKSESKKKEDLIAYNELQEYLQRQNNEDSNLDSTKENTLPYKNIFNNNLQNSENNIYNPNEITEEDIEQYNL